jgi:hypothetical protein
MLGWMKLIHQRFYKIYLLYKHRFCRFKTCRFTTTHTGPPRY